MSLLLANLALLSLTVSAASQAADDGSCENSAVLIQREQSITHIDLTQVEDDMAGQRWPRGSTKGASFIQAKQTLTKVLLPSGQASQFPQVASFSCSLMLVVGLLGGRFLLQRRDSGDAPIKAARVLAKEPAQLERWFAAVRAGDVAACQRLIEANRHITKLRDSFGCTALHVAAHEGSLEVLQLLLIFGATVDATDSMDETALHMAARRENGEPFCRALLAAGAAVNATNYLEQTPLVLAAEAKRDAATRCLLDAGGTAAGLADDELPPTLAAALASQLVTSTTNKGDAFDRCSSAIREHDVSALETELTAAPKLIRRRDDLGCALLHYAAAAGNRAAVQSLLRRGASVDATEAYGETALHVAARSEGGLASCLALLAARADVNAQNLDGVTPLVAAARAILETTCDALLERGGSTKGLADSELPPLLTSLLVERVFESEASKP